MDDLTGSDLGLICHALGWPKMYRNHYAACPGSPEDEAWLSLVERGFAFGPYKALHSPDNFYEVSVAGRRAAERGE